MKTESKLWFKKLRDDIISMVESYEKSSFVEKEWHHSHEGGGLMSTIRGNLIEKGGVNISTVSGVFSEKMREKIPGAKENPSYWATGISVVLHPLNPNIPSMHFNTRFLETTKNWFGGGIDLTPCLKFNKEKKSFHDSLEKLCDKHDNTYYSKYKKWCDEYFFIKHRNETRGVGGIFFDYLNSGNMRKDFLFTKDVGKYFLEYVEKTIVEKKDLDWTDSDKEKQYLKRGRYVEFNLVYDRGTKFGLETGGNTDAILMSLPPQAKWQ
jgi:coproporphyrinogen III oxidase